MNKTFVKSIPVTSIQEIVQKATAAETLGMTYRLEGTLKEFTYDIMDGNIIGDFSTLTEKIEYLREYHNFDEDHLYSRHIRANDDKHLPKEDIIELDVIDWKGRFFVLDNVTLEIYNYQS